MSAISIIIPVYNAEKYLRRCLDNLQNQSFANWEAICVNDGSTDTSKKILAEYAKKDPRFKIINKNNAGVSAARNDGLIAANGAYIHFMDADDFIDNDYYEKMFAIAVDNDADMVCSGFVSNSKHTKGIKYNKVKVSETIYQKIKTTGALFDGYVWRYLIKKEFIDDNKLSFNKKLISQEDSVFVLHAISLANMVITVPHTNYHYIMNVNSALNSKDKKHHKKIKEHYIIGKKFRRDFAKKHNMTWLWKLRKLRKIPIIGKYI